MASGPGGSHLDVHVDDVEPLARRALDSGATVTPVRPDWTVMADPSGAPYCVTRRDPRSGRIRP